MIEETKDNILGLSTEENNMKTLLNLIDFAIRFIHINSSEEVAVGEIRKSIRMYEIINENRKDLFKSDIRLFLPSKIAASTTVPKEINLKEMKITIENTEALILKLDKKISKLKTYDLNYANIDKRGSISLKNALLKYNKSIDCYLRDFNALYEKELKYIPPEKLSKLDEKIKSFFTEYNKMTEVANDLTQIFSVHNKITYKNIKENK